MKRIMLAAMLSAVIGHSAWAAPFTIEGDARSLTLVAEGATRAEVVAALAERFDMEIVGGSIEDGVLDGRYAGSLGQVLKSILPANGYALAYREGKPSRVTFTGVGGSEVAAATPAAPATPPPAMQKPKEAAAPERLTLEGRMQRDAWTQVAPPAPPQDSDASQPDREQIKAMTDAAVEELKELARGIRQIRMP